MGLTGFELDHQSRKHYVTACLCVAFSLLFCCRHCGGNSWWRSAAGVCQARQAPSDSESCRAHCWRSSELLCSWRPTHSIFFEVNHSTDRPLLVSKPSGCLPMSEGPAVTLVGTAQLSPCQQNLKLLLTLHPGPPSFPCMPGGVQTHHPRSCDAPAACRASLTCCVAASSMHHRSC